MFFVFIIYCVIVCETLWIATRPFISIEDYPKEEELTHETIET